MYTHLTLGITSSSQSHSASSLITYSYTIYNKSLTTRLPSLRVPAKHTCYDLIDTLILGTVYLE